LPLEGALRIDGERFETDELAYLGIAREAVDIETLGEGRALLIGGKPLDEEITIWWNFVGHSRAEIEQAQRDWNAEDARFGRVVNAQRPRLAPPPIPWARSDDAKT
ncbi:MAG: pirin family protein, partial [Gammaproteobacteria bacterium]|nr:pirin family protein [Gammaproteobacteria bacterium]